MVQMILYGVYRNSGEKLDIEKKMNPSEQQLKTIVVMSPLGVSEVHPIDVKVTEPVVPFSDVVQHEDPSKVTNEVTGIHDVKCLVEIVHRETV